MTKTDQSQSVRRTDHFGNRLRKEVCGYIESRAFAFFVVTFMFNTPNVDADSVG